MPLYRPMSLSLYLLPSVQLMRAVIEQLRWVPGVQAQSTRQRLKGCTPRQRAWVGTGGGCPEGEVLTAWGLRLASASASRPPGPMSEHSCGARGGPGPEGAATGESGAAPGLRPSRAPESGGTDTELRAAGDGQGASPRRTQGRAADAGGGAATDSASRGSPRKQHRRSVVLARGWRGGVMRRPCAVQRKVPCLFVTEVKGEPLAKRERQVAVAMRGVWASRG